MAIIEEKQMNLFDVSTDYILVHCISSDYALGAGIAVEFANRGVRDYLNNFYEKDCWNNKGYCIMTPIEDWLYVGNLVTKEKRYLKPTYKSLRESLEDLKLHILNLNLSEKIAMPKIGCGLDRLEWNKVKQIIKEVFNEDKYKILVCYI